ncbi:Glutaredoxin domain-containing protein [Aphelenchoides bicaudatus]|nr:Glutaredoxin domain-containing protein [Aphelenchoides bicaudatus]
MATAQNAQEFVESVLRKHKVVGISKTNCPYSQRAKVALETFKLNKDDFYWLEIDNRDDMEFIQNYMEALTGGRTVPRVFINGNFFGDGDTTVAALNSGRLGEKLKEENVI